MNLLRAISEVFNPPPPDKKRFANAVEYPANFHGELVGAKKGSTVYDRVRIGEGGQVTFSDQSAFSNIEIPSHLTDADVLWLKKKKLDASNPAYARAKSFFASNPTTDKKELAKASGIGEETAKDVIAGFRYNVFNNPSPTAKSGRFYGGEAGEGKGER